LFNEQGKQLWNFTTVGDVTSISISRKGNFIVVGDDKGYVYLLDKNGTLLWDKKIVEVNCDAIYVSISADGKNIGVGMQIHYENDKIGILTQEGNWLLSPTQVEHIVVGISIASNEKPSNSRVFIIICPSIDSYGKSTYFLVSSFQTTTF